MKYFAFVSGSRLAQVSVAIAAAVLFAASCSNVTDDCHLMSNCTGGGAAGIAGIAGIAGSSGIAGTSSGAPGVGGISGAGQGGTSEGGGDSDIAGEGGGAGTPPCDGSCAGLTPICDLVSNACVACVGNGDCTGAKPACDIATNTCVECTDNPDCKDAAKPFCDKATEQCVACLAQSDCADATASACRGGQCQPCTSNAECSNIAGKGVCDAGTCVQCTGSNFGACGLDAGTPLVCDSLKRTCSTSKQYSSGLCQTCVSDAQCNLGEMCVFDKLTNPAKDVGYFCHWKQGDTANGAPTDCTAGGRPYVGVQKNAVSIDGVTSDICSLRACTCIARNQFSSKDCLVASAPSDAVCGVSSPKDAKCAQFGASTYRCTMTCLSDDDCPSPITCNTGANPAVCNLN